jgi:hypothetical protein
LDLLEEKEGLMKLGDNKAPAISNYTTTFPQHNREWQWPRQKIRIVTLLPQGLLL